MIEVLTGSPNDEGIAEAARLLHDFNAEYGEPAPSPEVLTPRLAGLVRDGQVTVLLARAQEDGTAIGVAVMRVQPSIVGLAQEAYLAELYVVPTRRGQGHGRELITAAMRVAREQGRTTPPHHERERPARPTLVRGVRVPAYRGRGGPVMLAYECDLRRPRVLSMAGLDDVRRLGMRWSARTRSSSAGRLKFRVSRSSTSRSPSTRP